MAGLRIVIGAGSRRLLDRWPPVTLNRPYHFPLTSIQSNYSQHVISTKIRIGPIESC